MKYEIWQIVYIVINWTIKQYTIKWYFEKKKANMYIICDMWKDTVIEEKNIFNTLENAKIEAIEFLQKNIDDINKVISEIKEVENIELTPEFI